jgi:hypothetical protein
MTTRWGFEGMATMNATSSQQRFSAFNYLDVRRGAANIDLSIASS